MYHFISERGSPNPKNSWQKIVKNIEGKTCQLYIQTFPNWVYIYIYINYM